MWWMRIEGAVLLGLVLSLGGCSKEDLTGALDQAKSAVSDKAAQAKQAVQQRMESATEQAQEQMNLAGSIELTAGAPLSTSACYVSFLPQGSGRPTILQIKSYRDIDRESFPSVFLQAQVQANSIAELIGEPVTARLFVQREAQGPILFSDTSTPIEVQITAVADRLVSAELTRATLRDTNTGAEIVVTGKFQGVLE